MPESVSLVRGSVMIRTATFALLFAAAAGAQNPVTDPKASYPADQRDVATRIERIQGLQRAIAQDRFPARRAEGLERVKGEVEAVQAALYKRLTGEGVKEWVCTVKVITDDAISFEVTPGLLIRASHAGMDGLTRGTVKGLVQGQAVTVSVGPVLLADFVPDGPNLVAIVGGRHLTVEPGRPK